MNVFNNTIIPKLGMNHPAARKVQAVHSEIKEETFYKSNSLDTGSIRAVNPP